MKRNLLLYTFMLSVIFSMAQPVGGFLGKRFLTSVSMEIIPGFQQYEANVSDFANWSESDVRNYTPRTFISTEYQYKRRNAVVASIGYARLQVPYQSYQTTLFDPSVVTQPMNAIILQFQNKRGLRGRSIAHASSYFAYGLNINFLTTTKAVTVKSFYANRDDIVMLPGSTSLLNFNLEWGRRMIFDKGWLFEFGISANIGASTFKMISYSNTYGLDEYYSEYDPEIVTSSMKVRAAVNSVLNFKIAIGKFY